MQTTMWVIQEAIIQNTADRAQKEFIVFPLLSGIGHTFYCFGEPSWC
jgi:hypothetical protein